MIKLTINIIAAIVSIVLLIVTISFIVICFMENKPLRLLRMRWNKLYEKVSTYKCRLFSVIKEDWQSEKIGLCLLIASLIVIVLCLMILAYCLPFERCRGWNIIAKFFTEHSLITNLLGTFLGVILIFIILRPRVRIEPQLLTLPIEGKKHLKVRVRNLGVFPVNHVKVQLLFYRYNKEEDKDIKKTKKIDLLRTDMPILKGIMPFTNDSTYGCGTVMTIEELIQARKVKNSHLLYEGILCRVSASHTISGVTYVREHLFDKDEVDAFLGKGTNVVPDSAPSALEKAQAQLEEAHKNITIAQNKILEKMNQLSEKAKYQQ